jgi:hypothetical protein
MSSQRQIQSGACVDSEAERELAIDGRRSHKRTRYTCISSLLNSKSPACR